MLTRRRLRKQNWVEEKKFIDGDEQWQNVLRHNYQQQWCRPNNGVV